MPRPLGFREAADHRFLPEVGFDFQPGVAPNALAVSAGAVLGHDPFKSLLFDGSEEGNATLGDVLTQVDAWQALDDSGQDFFAPRQWQLFEVVAVKVKQIKYRVHERAAALGIILDQLKLWFA